MEPRVQVNRPAVLENDSGRSFECTILDISSGSFRLQVPSGFEDDGYSVLRSGDVSFAVTLKSIEDELVSGVFLD